MSTRLTLKEIKVAGKKPEAITSRPRRGIMRYRLWKYYVNRPASYYVAWVLARLGFSATGVTGLGMLIGLASCSFFIVGGYKWASLGAVLMVLRTITDNADGTLARATRTDTRWGTYLDGLVDSILNLLVPIAIGIGLYRSTGQGLCVALGLLPITLRYGANVMGFWYHTVFHGASWDFLEESEEKNWKITHWVGRNLIAAETLVLLVFALIDMLPFFLALYAVMFAGAFAEAVRKGVKMAKIQEHQAHKEDRDDTR